MKIGILTQPLHHNYGGLLQNFALQQCLQNLGHEPITIDWAYERCNFIRFLKKILIYFKSGEWTFELNSKEKELIYGKVYSFIDCKLIRTSKITNKRGFLGIVKKYSLEGIVVGSDQVWRPNYNPFLYAMFLDFVRDYKTKKVAYAASFGTDNWEFDNNQTKKCSFFLKSFNGISVREKTGINMCLEYFKCDAIHVLDPTLLLRVDVYNKLAMEGSHDIPSNTLLYYILNPEITHTEDIDMIAKINNLVSYSILPKYSEGIRSKYNVRKSTNDCIYPSVQDWLCAFKSSNTVITDSFHGMVFSIIFHKNFWVISNKGRGNSRFHSLLDVLGLSNRLLNTLKDIDNSNFYETINWDLIDTYLEKEKEISINFLITSLS